MRTYSIIVGILVGVFVLGSSTLVHANEIEDALKRLDAMISEMQKLRADLVSLSGGSAPTPTVLGAQTSKVLTKDLSYGATNDDIARIQRLLATDPAIYEYGQATGFFGPKTQEAIRNLQRRFGLDPVGVIGPATTAIFEAYFRTYPDEKYPAGVLSVKPQVLGVSTSNPSTPTTPTTPTTVSNNPARSIEVEFDRGEADVEIDYVSEKDVSFIVTADTEDEAVEGIIRRTDLTKAQINAVISFEGKSSSKSSKDYDEDDAEEMIDDADDAIDDAEDEIDEADEDGEDVDWAEDTLDEAKDLLDEAEEAFDDEDYDEAYELAEEAEELAEEAEDRIGEEKKGSKGDIDDIKRIEVEVDEDESEVTVKYEDGDDYEFTIEEDKEDEIIEEIADELDMDEDDVEDLIEFDYGKLDEIDVLVEDGEAEVVVTYRSGVKRYLTIDEDDEDEMIEEIADEIDEDVDDVEDVIDFDYS